MTIHYQQRGDDEDAEWSVGNPQFGVMYDKARDRLRFHRGDGFKLREKPEGDWGQERTLGEVGPRLRARLDANPVDTVIQVKSLKDDVIRKFRRHEMPVTAAERVQARLNELIGTPYVFGATDCSWYSMQGAEVVDVTLPHNAHLQRISAQVHMIPRADVRPFDLLFHWGDEHVSWYLDDALGGRVMDTEPHDTAAPAGWPTSFLGVGVRIRPMKTGYYCDWEHVNAVGRLVEINGAP